MENKILEYLALLRDFGRIYTQKIISGSPGMKLDLKLSQVKAMYAFRDTDSLSANELAKLVGTRLSTATIMTDSLEKDGIIKRERDSADRRRVMIQLTVKGKKLRRDFLAHRQRIARSIFVNISEQQQNELQQALATVCATLKTALVDETAPAQQRRKKSGARQSRRKVGMKGYGYGTHL